MLIRLVPQILDCIVLRGIKLFLSSHGLCALVVHAWVCLERGKLGSSPLSQADYKSSGTYVVLYVHAAGAKYGCWLFHEQ
jgi:hypothetical protein